MKNRLKPKVTIKLHRFMPKMKRAISFSARKIHNSSRTSMKWTPHSMSSITAAARHGPARAAEMGQHGAGHHSLSQALTATGKELPFNFNLDISEGMNITSTLMCYLIMSKVLYINVKLIHEQI